MPRAAFVVDQVLLAPCVAFGARLTGSRLVRRAGGMASGGTRRGRPRHDG